MLCIRSTLSVIYLHSNAMTFVWLVELLKIVLKLYQKNTSGLFKYQINIILITTKGVK